MLREKRQTGGQPDGQDTADMVLGPVPDRLRDVEEHVEDAGEIRHRLRRRDRRLGDRRQRLDRLPHQFGGNNPGKGFSTFWDLPMDTWQRLAANIVLYAATQK